METNIYLDVDGVLLANEKNAAEYASEFIEYVITRYPDSTYWLTTRCRGDATEVLFQLKPLFSEKIYKLLEQIKPTNWDKAKTEAIDFTKPFLWFDDDLFDDEKEVLIKQDALYNHINVDLYKRSDQLADFVYSFPIPNNTNYRINNPHQEDKIQKALDLKLAELRKIIRERSGDEQYDIDEELYEKAKKLVIESGKVSWGLLREGLRIGYAKSVRLIGLLAERGILVPIK
jgi:hypothetical protein